jgi:hypothetical protein
MKLRRWRAKRLYRVIRPMLGYLHGLNRRAEQRLDPNEPLRRVINAAYNAVHSLSVKLHYRACEGGAGRPRPSA